MSTWISVDPANTSGWSLWGDGALSSSGTIAKMGGSGKWKIVANGKATIFGSELEAWQTLLTLPSACVCEVGRGSFRNADMPLGKRLGYIRAVCDMQGCKYNELDLSEWRRIVREQTGISWGSGEETTKALSIRHVKDLFGVTAGPDECEAILIGWAWIKSGRAV